MRPERDSALVVMRSPEPEPAGRARRFFADRGFEVGPLVGISFSIVAPRQQMERRFEGFERLAGSGEELPLDSLPPEIRRTVRAVTTEEPPDFGPQAFD